jgi:iron complex outermembrane receptor protein
MYANRQDRLGYRLAFSHDQNQQWRDRDALAYRADRFNGMVDYQLGNQRVLRAEGGVVDTNRLDAGVVFVRFNTPNNLRYARLNYEQPDFFIKGFWSKQSNNVSFSTVPALTPYLTVGDKNGDSTDVPVDSTTYDVVSQFTRRIGKTHSLILGINYRHNILSGSDVSQTSHEDRLGFYGQDEWRMTDVLRLTAGIRMDLDSEISPAYSPRVVMVFLPALNHSFRLSGTVGYRPPTLIETNLLSVNTFNLFGVTIPNVTTGSGNLKPEKIVSYEAEYQGWFFNHRLRSRGALFWNHIKDLIGTISPTPTTSTYINTPGVADIRGFEVGIEFWAISWLKGFANYSYQDTKQSITGNTRRGGSHSLVNGGFRIELENGLHGEAAVHYVGAATYPIPGEFSQLAGLGLIPSSEVPDSRVGSYTLLNLRGGYQFWRNRAEVAVSVFNALNDRHREQPLGDVIGSRVMGWFTLRL